MLDRVFKLSSNWSLFNEKCIRLKTLFLQLVYPGHLIYSMISSFITSKQTSAPPRKSTSDLSAISHSRPQSLRSFWPAAGIESSGSNHFGHAPQMKTEFNRMGRIRLFPLLFQNGCSQSSRVPAAGQKDRRLWGREWQSVRIVLPFKEQKSADSVRKQLH